MTDIIGSGYVGVKRFEPTERQMQKSMALVDVVGTSTQADDVIMFAQAFAEEFDRGRSESDEVYSALRGWIRGDVGEATLMTIVRRRCMEDRDG